MNQVKQGCYLNNKNWGELPEIYSRSCNCVFPQLYVFMVLPVILGLPLLCIHNSSHMQLLTDIYFSLSAADDVNVIIFSSFANVES